MSIYAFVYIFGTLLTPQLPEKISKRFTLQSSAFLLGLFMLVIGPSAALPFVPETLNSLIFGLFLTATLLAPLIIPALPEMI